MAGRSVSVFLNANVAGFVRGMRTAGGAVGDLDRRIDRASGRQRQALNRVGQSAGVMAAGLVAGFLLSVRAAMRFEKAMSGVKAATFAGAAEMQKLGAAALDAGKKTAFSASEAAAGQTELAKAGVSVADILSGGLKGALDLAAAGELSVGEAAETAATAMTQFKLAGKDIPHIADLLAAGAGKAQGSVHDLGYALKMSGLVANQFGLSVDETVGTLAAFASAGLVGSDAGTSLKTMLLHLVPTSDKARATMESLGISAFDAQGQFIGITALAGNLQAKLAHLTPELRNTAEAQIFGTDAIRGANVLYELGAKGIQGWIDKTNDAGFAAKVAATKMDNLSGDLKKLRGAIDVALIQGGTAATGALRGLTEATTATINTYSALPSTIQGGLFAIAGISGAALLGAWGLIFMTRTIRETRAALALLDLAALRAKFSLAAIGKFAATAALIVGVAIAFDQASKASDHLRHADLNVEKLTKSMLELGRTGKVIGELKRAFGDDLQGVTRKYMVDVKGVGDAMKQVADPSVMQSIDQWSSRTWGKFVSFPKQATDKIKALDKSLEELTASGHAVEAQHAFAELAIQAEKSGVSFADLTVMFPKFAEAQKTAASAASKHADSEKNLRDALSGAATTADELKSKLDALSGANMSAEQASINQAKAVIAASKASNHRRGTTLDERQALLDLAKTNNEDLVARKANGATTEQLSARQAFLTRQFVKQAMALGKTRKQAEELASGFGQLVPKTDGASGALGGFISKASTAAGAAQTLARKNGEGSKSTNAYKASIQRSLPVLYAMAGRSKDARAAVDKLAKANGVVAGKTDVSKAAFLRAAKAMKIGADEAEKLWAKLNKIKSKSVTVKISAVGTWAATANAKFDDMSGFATGGPVPAIGPNASRAHDSVPAMLRVDEHVWTPEEVDSVGGHAAMYRMRAAARRGELKGYAAGGAVSMSGGDSLSPIIEPIRVGYNSMIKSVADVFAAAWKKFASGGSIVAAARSQIGMPYSWGGGGTGGPSYGIERGAGTYGFDCSGLTEYAWWKGRGKEIGGSTGPQAAGSSAISGPRPGALGFVGNPIHHVMLASGNGNVIQAPYTGGFVEEVSRSSSNWRWPSGMAAGGEVRLGERVTEGRASRDEATLARLLQIAGSGPRGAERHTAQIAQGGDMRMWAEPESGGEAYVPLAPSKRTQSKVILATVARMFGMTVRGFADGGIVPGETLNLSDIMSTWTSEVDPATAADVTSAKAGKKTQAAQVTAAQKALAKAKRTHADKIADAEKRLRRALASKNKNSIEDAREALTRAKRTDTVRAAEAKLKKERSELAAATKKLADVEKKYQYAKMSPATQLGSALGLSIKNKGAFIKNLTTLADRGFGELARQLLAMGGTEAEKIAADAAKFSSTKLTKLQGQMATSLVQQQTLENLPNILTVRSSMKALGTGASSWIALLNSTGLDPGSLAEAVRLMAGDLAKSSSGQALLADMKGHGYAAGGWITGMAGRDRVPLWGTSGEYMVRDRQASKYGPLIEAINSDKVGNAMLRRYISGGGGSRNVRGGDGAAAPVINQTFHHQAMDTGRLAREVQREAAWALGT